MKWNRHIPMTIAALALALPASSCYLNFEEGLNELTVTGRVVIEAELAGVSSFQDLSPEELEAFINNLGVVYVGAWSGLTERQTIVQPSFDPFSRNAFPYGGTTNGAYAYGGLDYLLDCRLIAGRFTNLQNIIDYFDLRIGPDGSVMSRLFAYEAYIADGVIDETEAEAIQATGMYPSLTEAEYVTSLISEQYFRFYLPPPTAGCQYDEDGVLILESCEVSDFDFYGNILWTINADGDLEAPFTMYKVFTPLDANEEPVYPVVWAWADMNSSTCDETDGQYTSVSYIDTLNFPCEAFTAGDLISDYADSASAPRVTADGTSVEVRISRRLETLPDELLVDEDGDTYRNPYCAY